METYVAFYKGNTDRKGIGGLYERFEDAVIRFLTKGPYSHCEIAIKDNAGYYIIYSSSSRDKGVRTKTLKLDLHKWDLVPVKLEQNDVINYYNKTKGAKYDLLGALGILLPFRDKKNRFFCSEWCYNVIFKSTNGYRIDPNRLASIIGDIYGNNEKH